MMKLLQFYNQYKNVLLGLVILILLLFNVLTIHTYPKPDSLRYWETDESWSINWVKNSVTEGKAFLEKTVGSSVENKYTFKFGEHWIYNLAYGIPLLILNDFSVESGRYVSLLIGLLIAAFSYYVLLKITENKTLALSGVIIITASNSFIMATHCARYDILTTFYITLFLFFIINREKLYKQNTKFFFLLGLYGGASILVSLHAAAMAISLSLLVYLLFLTRKEFKFFISKANLFFIAALLIPLLLNILLSLAGIGNKPGLFFKESQNVNILNKAGIFSYNSVFEFLYKAKDKFLNFFEHSIYLLIPIFAVLALLFYKKNSIKNILKNDLVISLFAGCFVISFIYFVLVPSKWGAYNFFLIPFTVVTIVYLISLFKDDFNLSDFAFWAGIIIFIFASIRIAGIMNNKYDKSLMAKSIERFENIVKEENPLDENIVFANFHLSNLLYDKKELKYYTNFVDEKSIDYYDRLDSIIQNQKIKYILDISTARQVLYKSSYVKLASLFDDYMELEKIDEVTGIFDDQHREYNKNLSWSIPDTLVLYKIISHKKL